MCDFGSACQVEIIKTINKSSLHRAAVTGSYADCVSFITREVDYFVITEFVTACWVIDLVNIYFCLYGNRILFVIIIQFTQSVIA